MVCVASARTQPQAPRARLGGPVELVELIAAEQVRLRGLNEQARLLRGQLAALQEGGGVQSQRLDRAVAETSTMAGMSAVRGPGVTVVLSDSGLESSPSGDLNDLVVHEQDLQAVINALWAGGAEAVAVNGQRLLATTAIRCVGNTLLLHGRVYAPPYRITAIGERLGLRQALDRDSVVATFRAAATRFGVGVEVRDRAAVQIAPAVAATLHAARPAGREDR